MGPLTPLTKAGGAIELKGNNLGGHDGFEIIYYSNGSQLGEPEYHASTEVVAQTLAAAGKVYTSYDNSGRNVLRYVYNPSELTPPQFELTIRPLAAENYTYWA